MFFKLSTLLLLVKTVKRFDGNIVIFLNNLGSVSEFSLACMFLTSLNFVGDKSCRTVGRSKVGMATDSHILMCR